MALVANDPKAAKRLGIPQSVGKEFMKADKRKGKKYAIGGPTSYSGEDTGEGMEMSTRRMSSSKKASEMSDEEKYGKVGAAIRRLDPEAYKNRTDKSAAGNLKLLKELQEKSKSPAAPKVEVEKTETKVEMPTSSGARGYRGSKPGSTRVNSSQEKAERNRGVTDRFIEFIRNTRMVGGAPDYMKDETGRIRTPASKKYASGGSVSSASKRADGIAKKGKTRGKIC
jgi:hypothetical protein